MQVHKSSYSTTSKYSAASLVGETAHLANMLPRLEDAYNLYTLILFHCWMHALAYKGLPDGLQELECGRGKGFQAGGPLLPYT